MGWDHINDLVILRSQQKIGRFDQKGGRRKRRGSLEEAVRRKMKKTSLPACLVKVTSSALSAGARPCWRRWRRGLPLSEAPRAPPLRGASGDEDGLNHHPRSASDGRGAMKDASFSLSGCEECGELPGGRNALAESIINQMPSPPPSTSRRTRLS